MEEVMRLMAIRAPESISEVIPPIEIDNPNNPERVDKLRGSGASELDPPDLGTLEEKLKNIQIWVTDKDNDNIGLDDMIVKFGEILGNPDVIKEQEWIRAKDGLDTAILDGKFRKGKNRILLGDHAELRRIMELIAHVLGENPPENIKQARKYLGAKFVMATPTPPKPKDSKDADAYKKRKESALNAARKEIATFEGLYEAIGFFERMPSTMYKAKRAGNSVTAPYKVSRSTGRKGLLGRLTRWIISKPDFSGDSVPSKAVIAIDESALDQLSPIAREAVKTTGVDIVNQDLEASLGQLRLHQKRAQIEASTILEPFTAEESMVTIGNSKFTLTTPMAEPGNYVYAQNLFPGNSHSMALPGKEYRPSPDKLNLGPNCSPIVPSGFGQLLVVRQQLKGYERTEISHVENVLEGETRSRDHRRSVTTEETIVFEQITERTEERHLETTERFQLSSEVERISKSELEAKGELNVSGKYGPTVEFEASAGIQVNNSKEKSTKVAQEFAQETTEKAINKITEKVRQQRTLKIIEEVEETNHHGFENDSPGHIIGIYQWLNKIYEAQIYDYGLRLLFDIIVPEPAAFLISAFHASQSQTTAHLTKPLPFTKRPDQLTETNYYTYVDRYGAKDVQAPPEPIISASKTFTVTDRKSNWKDTRHAESGDITIPEGYEAVYGYMTATLWGSKDEDSAIAIHLDRTWYYFDLDSSTANTPMNYQQGMIPVAWHAAAVSLAAATIEIRCRRTEAALNQWRLDTHEKIRTAYEVRLSEYYAEQDKLALEAQEELEGGNPVDNKRLAETELKRAAISIIANKRHLFDLIDIDFNDIPFVDLSARLNADPVIRFLEQAFEWENMNYLYYPYFWGRKEPHWKEKIQFESTDSTFAEFVRAGAARVQLAVRPGFEDAIDHFLKTCEPWSGGDLPTISDPLYLAFADEMAAQLGRPGDEVPVGDPWDVRIPTNLVILRKGSDLPKWHKVNGQWVEINPEDQENPDLDGE